jgi:hypothetical protein
MTSFNATALLEFENIGGARRQLESGLSPIEVDVSASQQIANGSGGGAASALAAGAGASAADSISENVELSEVRNELLRDLLEATRKSGGGGGFSILPRGAGNILRTLGGAGGAAAAVVAGSLASVAWGDVVADAIGDIDVAPEDIVDPVNLTAPALIAGAATISAADAIADGATVAAKHVIDEAAGLEASDLVDVGATITAPALIAGKVGLEAADLIVEPLTLTVDKLVEAAKGSESGSGDGNTEPTGDSDSSLEPRQILGLGGAGVFGGALASQLLGGPSTGLGSLVGGATGAGLGAPVMPRNLFMRGLNNLGGKDFDQQLRDAGIDTPQGGPTGAWQFWQQQGDRAGDILGIDGRDPALEAGTSSYRAPQDIQLADDGSGRNTTRTVPEVNVTVRNEMDVSQSMSRQEFRRKFEDEVKDDLIRELYDNLTGSGTGVLP